MFVDVLQGAVTHCPSCPKGATGDPTVASCGPTLPFPSTLSSGVTGIRTKPLTVSLQTPNQACVADVRAVLLFPGQLTTCVLLGPPPPEPISEVTRETAVPPWAPDPGRPTP